MALDLGAEAKAKEMERKYEWLEAAESYEQALHSKSGISAAEIQQRIGFCYNQASRQTESLEEFKKLRTLAVEGYKNSAELFAKEESLENQGKTAQCNALAEYARSWLASSPQEKKKILDDCRAFGNIALKASKNAGDEVNCGKTFNILLLCLYERLYLASTEKEKRVIAQEGLDCGSKAISALSKTDNKSDLLQAYSIASLVNYYVANISEQEEERKKLTNRSLRYSKKAVAFSKKINNPYFTALSRWAAALCTLFFTEKIESALEYAKEMLQQGCVVNDNYLKGIASYLLALVTDWMIPREADPGEKKKRHEDIIRYAEDAIRYLQLVSQDSIIAETYGLYVESYSSLTHDFAITPSEKLTYSEKAVETGRKGLEYAVRSGSPDAIGSTLHALSKALNSCSNLKHRKDEKTKLLEEALGYRKEFIKTVERSFPSNEWIHGVGKIYAAQIQTELAELETDKAKKITLFENSLSDMEAGISHSKKWISSRPTPSLTVWIAGFEDRFGGTLTEMYQLTNDKEVLTRAIQVFNDSAEKFRKVDLPSRAAESYWKIARSKDHLGKYQEAAKNFEEASKYYKAAAQKIHQFTDFYQNYAIYMEAWNEIEKAKLAHKHEEYAIAKDTYEKTATLLNKSKLWNHLSPNFLAWSLLEHAEDLSRQERSTEATESFTKAAKLFEEAKKSVESAHGQLERIEQTELIKASDTREKYCLGRIALEEAKILDRQGDHFASSRKYDSAVQRFQKAADTMEESDRQELTPIIFLCRAWKTMTLAEAENSPDLYLEAGELFEESKEYSVSEKAKTLAMGHSRFCKALEAGTRFEDTRDMKLHLAATQHLESAASYYVKAGFKTASEYAIATQRLFEGYIYMDNANKETDPEKKARYYIVVERILNTSAQSYMKAKHPEKAEQVHRLLDKIKEERKLAMSLGEVLHASTMTSSTASFVTPAPTSEKAVGLERFERANIQGHLTVPEEAALEEDLEIQLDLVNVAKGFGLIVRIDNLAPKGFRVTEAPPEYTVKDGSIDLGGKRFDPLKVESIKILARATDFGVFKVSPQVVYIDETGQFRTCKPEAVHVKVGAPVRRFPEERPKKKYQIVYRNLLEKFPRIPKSMCRVALAQIGVSKSGDVVHEFYEEKADGLFGLRPDKVELVRLNVKNMIEIAHAKSVNVLLFPELTVDLNYGELQEDIVSLAKAYEMYIIPGSYHDQKTKRNVSVVIGPDGILWQQEKHIPAIIHYEGKMLNEGIDVGELPRKTFVCNTEFGRIAITICRDFLDMDLRVELKNVEPPIDLVLNPAFTPVTADFKAVHFDARRSIYAYCFFANVAEFGNSLISTPEKERVERTIPPKEEGLIYKDIDLIQLRLEREKWEKLKKKGKGFIQSTR